MTEAITFDLVTWDGARAYPSGVESFDDDPNETLERFMDEISEVYAQGGEIAATLPLAEPGQAILLVFRAVQFD